MLISLFRLRNVHHHRLLWTRLLSTPLVRKTRIPLLVHPYLRMNYYSSPSPHLRPPHDPFSKATGKTTHDLHLLWNKNPTKITSVLSSRATTTRKRSKKNVLPPASTAEDAGYSVTLVAPPPPSRNNTKFRKRCRAWWALFA